MQDTCGEKAASTVTSAESLGIRPGQAAPRFSVLTAVGCSSPPGRAPLLGLASAGGGLQRTRHRVKPGGPVSCRALGLCHLPTCRGPVLTRPAPV